MRQHEEKFGNIPEYLQLTEACHDAGFIRHVSLLDSIIQYDEIALERPFFHCNKRRSRNETSWKLSLNAGGVQGPLNHRRDFKEAQKTCKRLCNEYTAITGSGNKLIPPEQNKSDKGAITSLKALTNMHIDLMLQQDGDTIVLPQRIRLRLRHHDGNQAATCGRRGTTVFQTVPDECFFACWKCNLLAIDGEVRCKQYT